MPSTKIVVTLPDGSSHDVRIGTGVNQGLAARLAQVPALAAMKKVVCVTDENVGRRYLGSVKAGLTVAGYTASEITLPAGVGATPEVAAEFWQAYAQLGLGTGDAVLILGGCSVWNAAAFAAATYKGGIPVILLATTPGAVVDLACGGKAALDLPEGPGLASVTCVPAYVSCDVEALSTVPADAWKHGLAKVARTAMVGDEDGLFWLMEHAERVRTPESIQTEPAVVMEMLARAVVARADALGAGGGDGAFALGDVLARTVTQASGSNAGAAEALTLALRLTAGLSRKECDLDPGAASAMDDMLTDLGLPLPFSYTLPASDAVALAYAGITRGAGSAELPLLVDVGMPVNVPVTPAQLQSVYRVTVI